MEYSVNFSLEVEHLASETQHIQGFLFKEKFQPLVW